MTIMHHIVEKCLQTKQALILKLIWSLPKKPTQDKSPLKSPLNSFFIKPKAWSLCKMNKHDVE